MSEIRNVITENWSGHSHGEVEDALKGKLSEMDQSIEEAAQAGYAPPASGIPKTDLAQSVQTSLDNADSAVQDSKYVHTDNNYTDFEKAKLSGLQNYDDSALVDRVSQLEEAAQAGYAPPEGGIPKTDLAQSVQTSLDNADSAVQDSLYVHTDNNFTDSEKTKLFDLQNYDDTALVDRVSQLENAGFITEDDLPEGVECDEQMSSTSVKPVQNKVIKAYVDNLIQGLIDGAPAALDTLKELATALGNNSDAISAIVNTLSTKANASEVVKGINDSNGNALSKNGNGVVTLPAIPTSSDIANAVDAAMEGYSRPDTVVINSDGANIDDEVSDSILTAPSSRLLKEIYLNLRALFDSTNGLAGIAFLGIKPTWQTVDVPEHTITLNLTDVTAEFNNESVSGSFDASEGEVTIKLTPAQGTMILANNISIMLGSESVPFTLTTNNGSTLVTFILAGNVTFTAVASSGIGVQVSGNNVSANVQGVPLSGDNRIIILSHPEHFDWDGSIGLSANSVALVVNTDYTITDNQDGTKTITILKTFTSDAYPIVIAANAVEDDFAVLDLDEVGSNVVVKRGSDILGDEAHVYAGETISILPVGNNKVIATVTIGSSAATLQGDTYDGFTYTLDSNDVSSSGTAISITASATALVDCSVALPSTGSGIASVALTDLNGTAIQSPVKEGSGIKIVLTPDTDYTISNISIANMTEGAGYNVTDSNGVKTITIQHVTGNVSVTATASQPQKVTIQYNTDKWRKEPTITQVNEGEETTIVIEPMDTFKLAEVKYTIDGGSEQTGTIVDNACTLVVTANTSLEINTKSVMDVVLGKTISYNNSIETTRMAASPAGEGSLYVNSYIPVPTIHNGDTILYYHQFKTTSPRSSSGVVTYPSIGGKHAQGRACGDETYLSSTFQSKNDGHKFIRMAFRYSASNTAQETSFGDRSFALNDVEYVTEQDVVAAINYKLANS